MNLEINNLSFYFCNKKIFDNINISLKTGDLLIVNGKNGSGKTSLLKSIANLFDFSENKNISTDNYLENQEIYLNGRITCQDLDISKYKEEYFYTRSFVGADFDFYDEFDIWFYLNFWNMSNPIEDIDHEIIQPVNLQNNKIILKNRIESVIKYFNFEKFLFKNKSASLNKENIIKTKIFEISSGWKKRLQYSRLFFENRAIWILDEPFNFLDEDGKNLFINMINSKILSGGIVILADNSDIKKYINIDSDKIKFFSLS
jgi:heme exporter protein A